MGRQCIWEGRGRERRWGMTGRRGGHSGNVLYKGRIKTKKRIDALDYIT